MLSGVARNDRVVSRSVPREESPSRALSTSEWYPRLHTILVRSHLSDSLDVPVTLPGIARNDMVAIGPTRGVVERLFVFSGPGIVSIRSIRRGHDRSRLARGVVERFLVSGTHIYLAGSIHIFGITGSLLVLERRPGREQSRARRCLVRFPPLCGTVLDPPRTGKSPLKSVPPMPVSPLKAVVTRPYLTSLLSQVALIRSRSYLNLSLTGTIEFKVIPLRPR